MTERMQQVIDAMRRLEAEHPRRTAFTPNEIADAVEPPLAMAGYGNNSRKNGLRRMALATRITPALTSLRNQGVVEFGPRDDGYSGTAYYLVEDA